MTKKSLGLFAAAFLSLAVFACSGDGGDAQGDGTTGVDGSELPSYSFENSDNESAVAKSGQVLDHVLINDLKLAIGALDSQIANGSLAPEPGDVFAALESFLNHGDQDLLMTTDPGTLQQTYFDISSSAKSLIGKLAGNDDRTDHRDWDGGAFEGWGELSSPQEFVDLLFQALESNALAKYNGQLPKGPNDEELPVHVTANGLDLQQLTQKFLLMAITYSQATDDYLDDDVAGTGLLAGNGAQDGQAYTTLEHGWDSAFGYFGAALNYDEFTDEELAGKGGRDDWQGYHDRNKDGFIDLSGEYNFGASVNAAKRDLGSQDGHKTNFTMDIFNAFLAGRQIIAGANRQPLTEEALTALKNERNKAVLGWEKAIAATLVHYINQVLEDMARFDGDDYNFTSHAKHWSELKGFALGLQFNPRTQLSEKDFVQLHDSLGVEPVLFTASEEQIAAYQTVLEEARALLQARYEFAEENVLKW
jgi:hypothetical protein